MIRLIMVLSMIACIIGCGQKTVDTKAEGEKLMQISRDWSKSAATGNIDTTLSYWAEDAIVMSPGHPALNGKQAIRKMLEGSANIPGFKISWEPKTVSVSKSGDMAYMTEETQITMNDSLGKPFTEYNKAVTVWKKDANGSWKNVADIWNANPPR